MVAGFYLLLRLVFRSSVGLFSAAAILKHAADWRENVSALEDLWECQGGR